VPEMVTEYILDIFNYFRAAERTRAPTPYMHNQLDINSRMRAILVDWLVEVHVKFNLSTSTLYLCVFILDSYCSQNAVHRSKLQLVGVTALLVACKYEEVYPPEIKDCVFITDNAYTGEQVVEMEQTLLRLLEYNISAPTAFHFLVRFLRVAGIHATSHPLCRTTCRARYYLERCLQEHSMLAFKPSLRAATAVYLALRQEKTSPWTEELARCTEYTEAMLQPCARYMCEHLNHSPVTASRRPLDAVRKKFSSGHYQHISVERTPSI